MTTVTGYTAAKIEELMDEQIIDANVISDDLILETRGGSTINAGTVVGPQGPPGTDPSIVICTSSTRPTGGDLFDGLAIWETNTKLFYIYNGTDWVYKGGLWICTSSTRPTAPFDGFEIYETDTYRKYLWALSQWNQISGPASWFAAALTNGWVNYGGVTSTARISKVDGLVCIEGAIKNGIAGQKAFTLPVGYRPSAQIDFPGLGAAGIMALTIKANGDFIAGGEGSTDFRHINCSFRVG